MKLKILLLGLVAIVNANAFAAEKITIEHRTLNLTPDGVYKTSSYNEEITRDESQVWIQRVIPAAAPVRKAENDHDVNLYSGAQWIQNKNGRLNLNFIQTNKKVMYQTDPAYYETVGFVGDWNTIYYIFNPKLLQKMKKQVVSKDNNTDKNCYDCVWYEYKNKTAYQRVLWSGSKKIAYKVQIGELDGSYFQETKILNLQNTSQLPWANLTGYKKLNYENLLD